MIKHIISLLIFPALVLASVAATAQTDSVAARYIKVPTGYFMVLKQNDNILEMLEALARRENIPSAGISGIGFAEVQFGYFNKKTKTYNPKTFTGEMASMQGSIAWQHGKPSIHAHGVLTDKKFRAHGGHILKAKVGTGTLELLVTVHDTRLERKYNEVLGANELCLQNCGSK